MDILGGVSVAIYVKQINILVVKGWSYNINGSIKIKTNGKVVGYTYPTIERNDVYEKYPQTVGKKVGWEARVKLKNNELENIEVEVSNDFNTKVYSVKKIEVNESDEKLLIDTNNSDKRCFNNLIISRPFIPTAESDAINASYYYLDESDVSELVIEGVIENYERIYIESSLYKLLSDKLKKKCNEIDDFVIRGSKYDELKVVFLASSDTHVSFFKEYTKLFKNYKFVIPSLDCKDDSAAKALSDLGEDFIEIDYRATECKELKDFKPKLVLAGADWTSEFYAVKRVLKDILVPTLCLQEGPQDWNSKFWIGKRNNRRLVVQKPYQKCDILLAQGSITLNQIRPKYFSVTGSNKFDEIVTKSNREKIKVFINCNFTYVETKPRYEKCGKRWLESLVKVCEKIGVDYIISQHPRDHTDLSGFKNVIKSNAGVIKSQLQSCSVVVSRFSTVIYEGLALGLDSIYYNPHYEPMLTFNDNRQNTVSVAYNEQDLDFLLRKHSERELSDLESRKSYLTQHVGYVDGRTKNIVKNVIRHLILNSVNEQSLRSINTIMSEIPVYLSKVDKGTVTPREVVIFCRNPRDRYSGGRYSALVLAEGLAKIGHKVYFVTDNIPIFKNDFFSNKEHVNIEFILTKNFKNCIGLDVEPEFIIVIPGLDHAEFFYNSAIYYSYIKNSKLILLNFETPNWFNSMSPKLRDEKKWYYWNEVSRYCSAIVSISKEGCKFAKEYYFDRVAHDDCFYDFIHPAINSSLLNKVRIKNRVKRIILMTRFSGGEHKGGYNAPDLIIPEMKGYKFSIMSGMNDVPEGVLAELKVNANKFGVELEFLHGLNDVTKFELIKESSLVLFPSFFEGYGYPPVEASAVGTPCLAFDIPVLRELELNNLHLVRLGDWNMFKESIAKIISNDTYQEQTKCENCLTEIPSGIDFFTYGMKWENVFTKIDANPIDQFSNGAPDVKEIYYEAQLDNNPPLFQYSVSFKRKIVNILAMYLKHILPTNVFIYIRSKFRGFFYHGN